MEPVSLKRQGTTWVFVGSHGLRAGWSILFFAGLYYLFRFFIGTMFFTIGLVGEASGNSAASMLTEESIPFFAVAGAMVVMSLIEGRKVFDYNLAGRCRARNFFSGVAIGFAALTLLVGALRWGGWLGFNSGTLLAAPQAFFLAATWGCTFLLVGFVEEGLFRCYAFFTLARGLSFWWALAAQTAICFCLALKPNALGAGGVYSIAALGLIPCYLLHKRRASGSAFWQAAWVTSTFFAFYHTSNRGENLVGIFAVAAIGFAFCVSVRVTGSAWWAIGFHAAWDWGETFFYGTYDSGVSAKGHLLSAAPAGNALWSGGADGPEGSLLVIAVIALLLVFLVLVYGRGKARAALLTMQTVN